jgi:hypothetical protein
MAATLTTTPLANITLDTLKDLLDKNRETLIQTLAKLLAERSGSDASVPLTAPPTAPPTAPSEEKPSKKAAKPPREPRGPTTNPWILFTVRVEALIRANEESTGVDKEHKMPTVRVKQFASDLKSQKPYTDWTDEDIVAALDGWEPPAVSKQETQKQAAPEGTSEKKRSGPKKVSEMTPEELEAHNQKQAERKAKKAAAAAAAAEPEPAAPAPEPVAAPAPTPEPVAAPAPAPAPKKIQIKPKPKVVDLRFYSWTHDGEDYYTNERGDVVTMDFEWVGRFNGSKIDASVPEPADLAEAEMKE